MPLTREELEDMQRVLKEAFLKAKAGFNANKDYSLSYKDLAVSITALGPTATALMQVDERLRGMEENSVTKLPAKAMPGKG